MSLKDRGRNIGKASQHLLRHDLILICVELFRRNPLLYYNHILAVTPSAIAHSIVQHRCLVSASVPTFSKRDHEHTGSSPFRNPRLQQSASEKMQNGKVDLGPHATIVVREWQLLRNAIAAVTPIHVDSDYLGVARITAVSK